MIQNNTIISEIYQLAAAFALVAAASAIISFNSMRRAYLFALHPPIIVYRQPRVGDEHTSPRILE